MFYKGLTIKHRPRHPEKKWKWIAGKIEHNIFFNVLFYASTLKDLKININK